MSNDIIELTGSQSGPTSLILAGVHGDEVCGVEAFNRLLPGLRIERGRVWCIYANPRAIAASVRFTEANLNRMFKDTAALTAAERASYEYDRAQVLKSYFSQADALLDLHASYTPVSRRFVICEPNAAGIFEYLPADLVVSGFDAIEPGGTDYYMNRIGKTGICLECGYLGDPQSTDIAE